MRAVYLEEREVLSLLIRQKQGGGERLNKLIENNGILLHEEEE
jgi:hypothetical protein